MRRDLILLAVLAVCVIAVPASASNHNPVSGQYFSQAGGEALEGAFSGGRLKLTALPFAAATEVEHELGTITTATKELNLEEGNVFTGTLEFAGEVVFKVTHAPARPDDVQLLLTEGAKATTWKVESCPWSPQEPSYPTGEGQRQWAGVKALKTGTTLVCFGAVTGKEGARGATGERGERGERGESGGGEGTYEALTLSAKVEAEAAGGTPAPECVALNGRVFLYGEFKIKTGEEVKTSETVAKLPASCIPSTKNHWVPAINLANAKTFRALKVIKTGETRAGEIEVTSEALTTGTIVSLEGANYPISH